jgi:hypothetical protein
MGIRTSRRAGVQARIILANELRGTPGKMVGRMGVLFEPAMTDWLRKRPDLLSSFVEHMKADRKTAQPAVGLGTVRVQNTGIGTSVHGSVRVETREQLTRTATRFQKLVAKSFGIEATQHQVPETWYKKLIVK